MFESIKIPIVIIIFIILSIAGYNFLNKASSKKAPAADIKAVTTVPPSDAPNTSTPSANPPVRTMPISPDLPFSPNLPSKSPVPKPISETQFTLSLPSPSSSTQIINSPITVNPAPVNVKIDSVIPAEGNFGAEIILRGSGFGPTANQVIFYGPSVSYVNREGILSWSDNEIKTIIAPDVKGDYQIEIESSLVNGGKSNKISFKVTAGRPVILSIPSAVVPTQQITIRGEEFGADTGTINLYGPIPSEEKAVTPLAENCQISFWSDTQIRCTLPASLSVGSDYRVSLVTSDGRSESGQYIKVYENRIYRPVQESSKAN